MKRVLILGGCGFIGGHLGKRLKEADNHVIIADIKKHKYFDISEICNQFIYANLRDYNTVDFITKTEVDDIYQLASDVGGAGYISTGLYNSLILTNSALINLNVAKCSAHNFIKKLFFSSSSCVVPVPDGDYGLEKQFSERLYTSYKRDYALNIRIARFQNVFGSHETINTARERVVTALCRKVSEAKDGNYIEVWGSGRQRRSFVYIDDVVSSIIKLMNTEYNEPVNIGSDETISINELAKLIIRISGKNLGVDNIHGIRFREKYGYDCPVGVDDKFSSNDLLKEITGYEIKNNLAEGLSKTYKWVNENRSLYNGS